MNGPTPFSAQRSIHFCTTTGTSSTGTVVPPRKRMTSALPSISAAAVASSSRGRRRTNRSVSIRGALSADSGKDEIGGEPDDDAAEDPPGDERLVAEARIDLDELNDDVQDRAGRQREEADGDRGARPRLPDERAQERRAAADQAEGAEEAPARTLRVTGERRDDPEALGAVVEREADDQHERQARLAERRRLADRQAFGEVVQADPGRDQQRQPARARHPVDPG